MAVTVLFYVPLSLLYLVIAVGTVTFTRQRCQNFLTFPQYYYMAEDHIVIKAFS